ncbi:hypothetical protein [Paucisalibacillus globulus]|uniref:hypothetical protein n=1 Tax=Paucisalibacillus globulus TaxID=351095 RepID=UPI00040EE25D|nr:hypothetical protein [Paucisalibacillus globulus]
MDLLFWIMIGFIIIGIVVLLFIRKNMKIELEFIKSNGDSEDSSIKSQVKRSTKSIIWWIVGTTVWGIVSIFLVVSWFSVK